MIGIFNVLYLLLLCNIFSTVNGNGLLLLYKPQDISYDCAYSERLIYDVSYGMGMSDTFTMILRTLNDIDYECSIEVVTEYQMMIVVVIKFPTSIAKNCAANPNAFVVRKKNKCLRICDSLGDRDIYSSYFVFVVEGKVRLRFVSNSSLNSDINAHLYQVTTTSARKCPARGCNNRNETLCVFNNEQYCYTSGVVCDGIVNCGVIDWFDERKADCGIAMETLGIAPVLAVIAAVVCFLLATCHVLLRCLPPLASSFFIFNANEDNRLCIDPVFTASNASGSIEVVPRNSLIPVFSSSSSDSDNKVPKTNIFKQFTIIEEIEDKDLDVNDSEVVTRVSLHYIMEYLRAMTLQDITFENETAAPKRNTMMKSMAQKLQNTFQSFSNK